MKCVWFKGKFKWQEIRQENGMVCLNPEEVVRFRDWATGQGWSGIFGIRGESEIELNKTLTAKARQMGLVPGSPIEICVCFDKKKGQIKRCDIR